MISLRGFVSSPQKREEQGGCDMQAAEVLFWGPEFSHAPLENRTGAGSLPGDGERGR